MKTPESICFAYCRKTANEHSLIRRGADSSDAAKSASGEIAMAKGQDKPSKEKKKPKAETSKKGSSSYKQSYGKGK